MPVFEPLAEFFDVVPEDARIGTTHISIYMALLQKWNIEGGANPITINRQEIMTWSKIQSRQTYNKCLHQLNEYGYIKYFPSFNPEEGSRIYFRLL